MNNKKMEHLRIIHFDIRGEYKDDISIIKDLIALRFDNIKNELIKILYKELKDKK